MTSPLEEASPESAVNGPAAVPVEKGQGVEDATNRVNKQLMDALNATGKMFLTQTVSVGVGGFYFTVDGNIGWIRVFHKTGHKMVYCIGFNLNTMYDYSVIPHLVFLPLYLADAQWQVHVANGDWRDEH